MALEKISDYWWCLEPGPLDVHGHPRVFDAITPDDFVPENEGREGKAGLPVYTAVALRSGITALLAMPNEARRVYDLASPEKTAVEQTPIADLTLVQKMQDFIQQEAYIPTGVILGINPETAFLDQAKSKLDRGGLSQHFESVKDECVALKIYLAQTTGGNNIGLRYGADVAQLWHEQNPEKPVIFHVEGSDVAHLLNDIMLLCGKDLPVHIAHVSSREELEAVIVAKQHGMNVTCEATPHHLFLDADARTILGGHGCMKPSLKSKDDQAFLWANLKFIDMFASDCAPHRPSDKIGDKPAYGVTNHTVMLPLLLGRIYEDAAKDADDSSKLTMEDLYEKFCINPRQRFNLPLQDDSSVELNTSSLRSFAGYYERGDYLSSPFARLETDFHLRGQVTDAKAGRSRYAPKHEKLHISRTHLIRPKNIGWQAIQASERD